MVYDRDGREAETDMVIAAPAVTPQKLYELRGKAGGLICVATHNDVACRLGLPLMTEIVAKAP